MFWNRKATLDSNRGQPRRRVKPFWRKPVFLFFSLTIFFSGACFYAFLAWDSKWLIRAIDNAKSSVIRKAANNGFVVREVLVEGRLETSREDLIKALGVERGSAILGFNAKIARLRVESLPWVYKAAIRRQLPDSLHLFVWEHRPMALWQRNGKFSLLDTKGRIIPLEDISGFANLIVLIGNDAPKKAAKLFQVLAQEPELANRVKAAVRVGQRRWNLHLNNATQIYLPEYGVDNAWSQLAGLFKKQKTILDSLEIIDLRLADRMIIREREKILNSDNNLENPRFNSEDSQNSLGRQRPELDSGILRALSKGKNT